MVGVVHCHRSPKLGSAKGMMEEPSSCNLSLAVDCTLSLGSTTSRTDVPARLSRAGSPDPDLALSLSLRSERGEPSRRTSDQDRSEQEMSWGGSCNRSDPDVSPEYYPQILERGARVSDGGRSGFKAWPRSADQLYKDEVNTPQALFGMIGPEQTSSYSNQASRQPWMPGYLPSSGASKVEQCIMEESDSCARLCAHCGTSKTPLWRNGPGGPKSLCNACGIRFKKAGRRSAANGTAESPVSPSLTTKVAKRKLVGGDDSEQQHNYWLFPTDAKPRKRGRGSLLPRTSESLLSGSCMTWQQPWSSSSPKSSALHRDLTASPLSHSDDAELQRREGPSQSGSFSSDEEEGAVLLMALSCGVVNA